MAKKAELVFVPAPGIGHLFSAVQFAKQLLDRDKLLSVTLLVIRPPHVSATDSYTNSLAAADADSRIRYVELPRVEPPPRELFFKSFEKYISDYLESFKPFVRDAITHYVLPRAGDGADPAPLAGVVVDFFCSSIIEVANELGVPSYVFFTSNAAFLGFMLYLPTRHSQVGAEFDESDPESLVPSYVNPVPASVLPTVVLNKEGGYTSFLGHATRFKDAKGIVVNTFAELEPHALKSLSDARAPPVYAVGPLIDQTGYKQKQASAREAIVKWLDKQPPSSVVLLCFGSWGTFDPTQLAEIAAGLEGSGQGFLWSIRRPPQMGEASSLPGEYADYEEVLPGGFLERVGEKGKVCGWVPQVEVLAHRAIGAFVSHCGWNSILESLWFGVPIVTWPIYAEQQINAFEMVRELGLAVELRLDYRNKLGMDGADGGDVVKAEEIERAVRCVMDGDNPVRKKVKDLKEKIRRAIRDGGSSFASVGRLIHDMRS